MAQQTVKSPKSYAGFCFILIIANIAVQASAQIAAIEAAPKKPSISNADANSALPEPTEADRAISIERAIDGFYPEAKRILIAPQYKNLLVTLPFNDEGKNSVEKFGKPIDSQRVEIKGLIGTGQWNLLLPIQQKILMLNGANLAGYLLDAKSLQMIMPFTLVWDTLLPPRDRGGEAPAVEIAQLRARFKKQMQANDHIKFTGIAPVPAAWTNQPGTNYLLTTRIAGFPLLLMNCQEKDIVNCQLTRACYVSGVPSGFFDDIAGIVTMEKNRTLLLANRKLHTLATMKFNSCFHISWQGHYVKFPAKLKPVVQIHADQQQRLWAGTELPDDYTNASLFFWPKEIWQKAMAQAGSKF